MLIGPAPGGGWACVLQADHAVMVGEIADALGSDVIGGVPPRAVVDAAYGHELGWRGHPEVVFNPETGLPLTALEEPLGDLLPLQLEGPRLLGEQDPTAGLLSSLKHMDRYEEPRPWALIRARYRTIRRFRAASKRLQRDLRKRSSIDPVLEPWAAVMVDFSDRVWHAMLGRREGTCWELPLPGENGQTKLELRARGSDWEIDPWPFRVSSLSISGPARILEHRLPDQKALDQAFEEASVIDLRFNLTRP